MKTNIIYRLFLSAIICLPIQLAAQKVLNPEINPNLYRTEIILPDMGLSSPLITCIYEDRYGFVWIGTQYGLDLYDGYAITQMNDLIADAVITSFEWVWSIDEDRSGTLWVCSSKGLFRYDRLHHSFEMLLPNLDQPDSEDNVVYSIKQDSKDIYWLFTKGGLFSYNREEHRFKDYKKDSIISDETGISVRMLLNPWIQMRYCEDHSGTLWIGTEHGLKKYDRKNDQYITFRHDPDDPESISADRIDCVIEDRFGTIWISAYSATNKQSGLNMLMDAEKGVFKHYYHDRMDPKSLVGDRIWPLYIDRDSSLWIGGHWGFSRYNYVTDNFDNFRLPYYEFPRPDFEINKQIFRIIKDSRGNLWMLTVFNGLFSFDAATDRIVHYYYDPSGTKNLVPDIHASTILEDRSGSIWVSGSSRITRSDPLYKPFYTKTGHGLGLDPEGEIRIMSLHYDEKEILWLGVDEYGLVKSSTFMPGQAHEFELIHPDIQPYCFLRDHNDQLWMGTINNGLGKVNEHSNTIKWLPSDVNGPDGLHGTYVGMMYEDRRNIFWIVTNNGGLNIFDPEDERFISVENIPGNALGLIDNLLVINEDRHGDMWFGSFNFGVSRLATTQGLADSIRAVLAGELEQDSLKFNFRNFKNNPFDPHTLSGNQINDMYTDAAGRLWIGTTNGLNLFDETNEFFYVFTTSDGLADNCIFGILEDDHGNLWLSSRKGICKVLLKDGIGEDLITSVHSYKKEDGLQGDMFYENTCQKTENGWMFFGGIHGLTFFHPDSIKENYIIPPVYITDVLINEQSAYSQDLSLLDTGLFETDKIELSYNQNFMAFEYLALNYSNAEQNQYKYMMVGLDKDWVEAGNRRYAEYRDLKPGEYTFRVLGSNDDGVWNEEGATLGIIIHPPWYRTMLAYILYVIMLALAIYGYIRWRTFRLRKDKEILEKQVKERTKTIEEQKGEIMDANTELQEQKEELVQQKEELQITLDRLNETQAQLIQSEKLAALGGLVAGVAHEINTPVGISVTAASSLAEETQQMAVKYKENKISRSEFKDYLNTANQSAKLILANMERTASMVQSFKQVSVDQSTEQKRVFKLKEYSEDVIRSMYPRLKGKKVKINLEIDDQLELNSYPGAFSQILTNLVLNSVVHGFEKMDHGNINLTAHLEKKELQMEYHDNGRGIPEENLDKIFDPFFTTNKKAGTGLGLHIVYNIVNQKLKGSITCSSEKEKGVSFRMKIPV